MYPAGAVIDRLGLSGRENPARRSVDEFGASSADEVPTLIEHATGCMTRNVSADDCLGHALSLCRRGCHGRSIESGL